MIKKAFWISLHALVVTSVVFLSACQPTPKEAVVADKSGSLLNLISEPALPKNQLIETAPKRWEEELEFQSGVQIVIDAIVEIPDVSAYPVIEVTPHQFSQEEAQYYVDILMQGNPIFEMSTVRTQDDLEKDILRIKADIEHIKTLKELTEDQRDRKLEELERELKDFEAEHQKAPKEAPKRIPATVAFQPYSDTSKAIQIQSILDNNVPAKLEMHVSNNGIDTILAFFKSDRERKYNVAVKAKDQLAGMAFSKQDALEQAVAFLESIGIADTQLAKTEAFSDGYAAGNMADLADNPDTQKSYQFYFVRSISGIPVTPNDFSTGITGDDNQKYDQVWPAEMIRIWVDDGGVYGFFWSNMDDFVQVLNENVALLDYDKIIDIFKKQIFFQRTWSSDPPYADNTIVIEKITLGMMRVRLQDNQYVYLTVWDFIGDWTHKNTETDDVSLYEEYDVSFLTINAIDGSIIDRDLGY